MISLRWVERPNGIVGKAYQQALDIIDAWAKMDSHIYRMMIGWPRVHLAEKIAADILEAQGYDPALLETAVDGGDYPRGWSAADFDAELERTRNKWDK